MNKKLLFILGAGRSGTTLLLSYLLGIPNIKVLYESKILSNRIESLEKLADYFDSIEEEIVIEKTPCHCLYLEDIERLRSLCKRNIHVIYVTRPPVPTILSILKASNGNSQLFGEMDVLSACEKYEEAMISIYHNLITRVHHPNTHIEQEKLKYTTGEVSDIDCISTYEIPYSFCITYRELIEDAYSILDYLLVYELHLDLSDSDIRGLIVNRVNNINRLLPQVEEELHHSNLFKEVDVVAKERFSSVSNLTEEDKRNIKYINNYFTNKGNKFSVYDLVTKNEVITTEDSPLVTIVVPLYNKEKYIEETLSSLLNQTYQKIHIIVVDDGSTDNSLEIVDKYIKSLDESSKCKISILTQDHFGVSEARNRGFPFSCDIITFCDADDIWDLTLVEKSVATFKKYPYVGCVYSRVLIDKDGEITKNHSKICNGDVYEDALEYNFLTCGSNLFVKASVIEEHSIRFNTSLQVAEDWDFLIRLAKIAVFKCTKEYLVTYRQVPNSLSTNKELLLEDSQWVLMTHLDVLESHLYRGEKYSRIFTRLFLYCFSIKNLKWSYLKDLDINYILRVVVNKLKSFVKSYIL